jgi:RimJ/RimL family protein N-acetyltransferase
MADECNAYGQRIGHAMDGWTKRQLPPHSPLIGRYCRLEKLDAARHAADLYAAYAEAPDGRDWTYLSVGPFKDLAEYAAFAQKAALSADPLHHAIIDNSTDKPVGTAALMRMDPDNGVIEVGFIVYSPRLQCSRAGTEAMFLLMRRVFDELGYRRYEWKCDSLNLRSRKAAERYGFQFEGIFRQVVVYKGRNRDTAWLSITDREWPSIRNAFEQWVSPENFDEIGNQRRSLSSIRTSGAAD